MELLPSKIIHPKEPLLKFCLMRFKFHIQVFVSALLAFSACTLGTEQALPETSTILSGLKKDTSVKYARRFAISENEYCKVVYLFGNINIRDTAAVYIILKNPGSTFKPDNKTYILPGTCKKIASLSSVYTSMLAELGSLDNICAVENIDYYNNRSVLQKFEKKELQELSKGPKMDVEKTVLLHPDIIFTFGMGNPEKDVNQKIVKAGIPMVIAVDHLEESPLARAEWIKFFAAFVDKKAKADSIFSAVEKNYHALKTLASTMKIKPTVFSEIKFGEIWYVPGGKSFAATFFRDAGSDYIWKDDQKTGSLHLGFEEVYVNAKDADFWLNMALVKSKKELIAQEPRYGEFKAFKTGNLYNNIKTMNDKGFSDYWETGIIFPDKVLHDLIRIFHPDIKTLPENDLYYYKKLD
jgi:iron complex transport system substrate-binding protein